MNTENSNSEEKKGVSRFTWIIGGLILCFVILVGLNVVRDQWIDQPSLANGTPANNGTEINAIISKQQWLDQASNQVINALLMRNREPVILTVMTLDHGSRTCQLDNLTDDINTRLNAKIPAGSNTRIVSRNEEVMRIIRQEIGTTLDQRGDFDPDSLVALGQKMGAQVVLTGKVVKEGDHHSITLNMIDMTTQSYMPGLSHHFLVSGLDLQCY